MKTHTSIAATALTQDLYRYQAVCETCDWASDPSFGDTKASRKAAEKMAQKTATLHETLNH